MKKEELTIKYVNENTMTQFGFLGAQRPYIAFESSGCEIAPHFIGVCFDNPEIARQIAAWINRAADEAERSLNKSEVVAHVL